MCHYEICILVHPDQSEEKLPAMIERLKTLVAEQTKIERVEDWGRRQLAYPVSKKLVKVTTFS